MLELCPKCKGTIVSHVLTVLNANVRTVKRCEKCNTVWEKKADDKTVIFNPEGWIQKGNIIPPQGGTGETKK